jgi:transcriptional regulator with XRE-family HTH domain
MRSEKRVMRNIKKLRELRFITREQMAAELEISVSGYGRLERGEVELTLTRMVKIAAVLDVQLSHLLDFEPSALIHQIKNNHKPVPPPNPPDKREIYREKYISMLEMEIDRLRDELRNQKT